MNIGIDIDDTISETYEALLPYAQKYMVEDLKKNPVFDTSIECDNHLYIESICHWNQDEITNFWKKYYAEMMQSLNIKRFAAEIIQKFKQRGDKIFLITARWSQEGQDTELITRKWLENQHVIYDELIIDANNKMEIAKKKNIDVFIDDSFHYCREIANNTDIKVLMMNSKLNEVFQDDKVRRVYSWKEIEYLLTIEKNKNC